MKNLGDYQISELKKLYKSYTLYIVTEYFKYYKRYKKRDKIDFLEINIPGYISKPEDNCVFMSMRIKTLEIKIDNESYDSDAELQNMRNEILTLKTCEDVLLYCTNSIDKYNEETQDQLLEELHMNDEFDKENDRATKLEILEFIWNTLQYCDLKQLSKLVELADNKFKIEKTVSHRPAFNKPIHKYDKENNLVATYINRAECMAKEHISKSTLSNLLSGRRKTNNGFRYVEED
jgi:hypothetical protein